MKKSKLTAVTLAILMVLQMIGGGIAASSQENLSGTQLKDIAGHWAENVITSLFEKGIIKGYETENGIVIKPEAFITRAEFLTILLKTKPSIEVI